ncbi:MAG: hypothetical protein M1814_000695 [Vezdaea aestivalis]|nr:MAG: hypothetical protein M1814_000695 [Vezdaea aestivalis]
MLSIISMFFYLVFLHLIESTAFSWREGMRFLFIFISCFAILYDDYRLTVPGLIFSITAATSAGISKGLHRVHPVHSSSHLLFGVCVVSIGLLGLFYFGESTHNLLQDATFAMAPILLLFLNLAGTTLAILYGKAWLVNIQVDEIIRDEQYLPTSRDNLASLLLVSFVGYRSVSALRRSYTSPLQLTAFLVAVSVFDNGRLLDLLRPGCCQPRWNTVRGRFAPQRLKLQNQPTDQLLRISRVCGTVAVVAWVAFIATNFAQPFAKQSSPKVLLDQSYIPQVETEIVLSAFQEPLESMKFLIGSLRTIPSLSTASIHIYVKDTDADIGRLKQATEANKVTHLPNIGREGETYLYHIVNNWGSLAGHTIFLQGDVHNPREFFPRIRDYFDSKKTGMLSLGFAGNVCNCGTCGDRWGWTDATIQTLYNDVHPGQSCSKILLSYKGQFIASAKRIRGTPKSVYEGLRDALVDEQSWAHKPKYLQGRKDSLNAPFLGFTLERAWNLLLQCSDMNVAWKCPTLLSGTRSGGNKGDCQCFDEVTDNAVSSHG